MDVRCSIDLLGRLQVRQGGRIINRFRTYKTGVLLAYLAFYPQRPHPREEVIEMLWPECEPALGRNSLSQSLSSLRHQLEPPGVPAGAVLLADRATIRLNPEAICTDVAEFEASLKAVARAEEQKKATLPFLVEAVERYHGELAPGYYEDWILRERERLAEAYLRTLDRLIAQLEQAGELERALDYAHRAVKADPIREESHADLIRLYAAAGQPAAALRQYQELKRTLEKELGISPDPALHAFVQKLTLAPRAPAPKAAAPAPPAPSALPTGTVTFLLLEVEDGAAESQLQDRVRRHGGREVKVAGGVRVVAFGRASDALACAVAAQQAGTEVSPGRMAIHTGEVREAPKAGAEFANPVLDHALRLLPAAHPGQILCSEGTAVLLRRDLAPNLKLTDLGLYRLRGADGVERLFEVDYPGRTPAAFPPPNAEPGHAGNLPLHLTRFFGREREMAQLQALLEPACAAGEDGELILSTRPRLITLTGPGGTGKTRLSSEVGRRMLEPFRGAVWLVPLADLSEARRIPKAILDALHLPCSPHSEPLQQVIAALSRQPTLLILDNFEQLLGHDNPNAKESVQIVRTLLAHVPALTCLVTSRQLLGVVGELEVPLAPLPTPAGPDTPEQLTLFESVRLFVDRAQTVRPDFQVTGRNAPAVAALCQKLEGIPLALELAAARCQVLTPAQILTRLAHRLDFLVSRQPDRDARHQTLRAAIDWSYCLLPEPLQRFFAQLSAFRGGWTLEAAETICAEPLAIDFLAQLRECSLVTAREGGDDPLEMRFQLLETLREYAEEKLTPEEKAQIRQRHADFFLALAEEADKGLAGPQQREYLARLDADHENLRAAFAWLVETGQAERALRLGGALGTFWGIRGHVSEGRERLESALGLAGAERTSARARVGDLAGTMALNQGDYAAARALYAQSLALYREMGNKQGVADLLRSLGTLAYEQGDYAQARTLSEESLALYREMGNVRSIAIALKDLGNALSEQGDYAAAHPLYEESLALFRSLGHRTGIATALISYGSSLQEQGDPARARALCEESLAIFRELGNKGGIAFALLTLGNALCAQGDYAAAQTFCLESLAIYQEMGDKDGVADALYGLGKVACGQHDLDRARTCYEQSLAIFGELGGKLPISRGLESLAGLARAQGQAERAAQLSAAADRLREAIRIGRSAPDRTADEQDIDVLRGALGEEVFAVVMAEGRAVTLEQAVAYALDPAIRPPGERSAAL